MSSYATPRRLHHRLLKLLIGSLLAGTAMAQTADPQAAQRATFKQAYAAAQQGGDSWRALASGLKNYPLYPYLPAAALEHDITQIDRAAVESYLKQYPDLIPAQDLRRDFLLELARRQDWSNFLALYQPGINDTLTCDALQARLANGTPLDFNKDLVALWAKSSLPSACDPVLQAAHDQGLLTDARLWSRIDNAIDAGKGGTVASLANWLPATQASDAQKLALALRDPSAAVSAATKWTDTPRQRQAAAIALQRLARRQSITADTAWQQLQQRFNFSTDQRNDVLHALALFHATDYDSHALARLIALPPAAQSDISREWRVRVALAQQDWPAVLEAINAMPASQQQGDEWRYFRARALGELGRSDEAQALYTSLAQLPNYFGFLAADRVNSSYSICPLSIDADPQRQQALLAMPGLQRAFELFALDLPQMARREWSQALVNADPATLQQAVLLANQRGWLDRAVYAFNRGDAMRYYKQRFPLATEDGVVPQAEQAGIDPAWAYGILRAESAWTSDARSAADARGLMQLVPDTAAMVAKRSGLPWTGGDSLYDPTVNIALGTRYLAQVASRFNGAPWLASAAYNAGPGRLNQWLAARGTLPPDVFVATIPFKETREYVARVMDFSVMYDWRRNGKVLAMNTRMPAIGQTYQLPDGHTPRKAVVCAVPVAPAPANTTSVADKPNATEGTSP
ncbi:MAG: transglycosylase SLT domain-containing protein [Rhodanobacter sp.]